MSNDKLAGILGDELRKIRIQAGFTQEKLALMSDVDRTYVSKLERGIRQPTLNIIFKLCATLKYSPEKLVRDVRLKLVH